MAASRPIPDRRKRARIGTDVPHRPPQRLNPLGLACIALAALGMGACASKQVGPPIDLEAEASVETLKQLMAQSGGGAIKESEHHIEIGDEIEIRLVGREDIFAGSDLEKGSVVVTDSPFLNFPLIGAVQVHAKTSAQLIEDLRIAYKEYIINPRPSVIIRKINRNQIAVVGAVNNPGKYPLLAGDRLMDGILKAGGPSTYNALNAKPNPGRYLTIYRERQSPDAPAAPKSDSLDALIQKLDEKAVAIEREEITVPIEEYLLSGSLTYNINLSPQDIVYLPSAGSVIVHGWVEQPGVAYLGPSVRTLSQVITSRGNLRFGAKSKIQVHRRGSDGQTQVTPLDARKILDREESDFLLQDGDQIYVDYSTMRAALGFFGEFINRGTKAGVSATYSPAAGL